MGINDLSTLAITVWKDGSWKAWQRGDAYYAQEDAGWLATINIGDAVKMAAALAGPVTEEKK